MRARVRVGVSVSVSVRVRVRVRIRVGVRVRVRVGGIGVGFSGRVTGLELCTLNPPNVASHSPLPRSDAHRNSGGSPLQPSTCG